MSEVMKDFAIKLFGQTISFPLDKVVYVPEQRQSSSEASTSQDSKDVSGESFTGSKHEDDPIDLTDETLTEAATSSEISDEPNTPFLETGSQEKTLKKPDKILPCPRCNSMDTKFCYYNNYNVSQPRHFCKKCQRYWTAGGTMRNVPVGSGRRKNKNASVTNYDHIMVSARDDAINGMHMSSLKPNGFLMFGSDRQVCESMQSSLNSAERSQNCVTNEIYENSSRDSFGPALGPSGFPVTFYPSMPYWGCAIPSSWNGPWASLAQSPTANSSTLGKHPREGIMLRPSNLGKENISEKISSQRPVLIPKTLRIHDPSEAAKSSIWSTLGIKHRKIGSTNGTSLFKAFESKGDRNIGNIDNSKLVLHANPAALSRSLNFHESS
ncbi:hypothetical protein BUALT_Bualt17G0071300 [Buddleja alternifolia]|uniref:Dof-type domain-containing protein n=1 Tax=Buddleja alternifolia TaxID=168488 RepID=A0AAV6W4N2_9LAMI|nr:hypothetical protein BUALT_Bualt17G0071300 [Buddleja alternifolia]